MTHRAVSTQTIDRATSEQARQAVAAILGCYPPRNGNSDEAAVYVASLAMVLEGQPLDVVQKMANPVGGLASRCKFMPTVADVTAMLVELNRPPPRDIRAEAEEQARISAEQDRIAQERSPEDAAAVKAMLADLNKALSAKSRVFTGIDPEKQRERFRRTQCEPGASIK